MASKINMTGLATVADSELQQAVEALSAREKEVEKLRTQLKEVSRWQYRRRKGCESFQGMCVSMRYTYWIIQESIVRSIVLLSLLLRQW